MTRNEKQVKNAKQYKYKSIMLHCTTTHYINWHISEKTIIGLVNLLTSLTENTIVGKVNWNLN